MEPLTDVREVLRRVGTVDATTPAAVLRKWRTEAVRASVLLSYALGIYSLDAKILERAYSSEVADVLTDLVDDLPELLATGWVSGGWSLSPDASASVAAAAEFDVETVASRLELHGEMVTSDLGDPAVVLDLLRRVNEQCTMLVELKDELTQQLARIQGMMLDRYTTGAASVDDWLS